MDKKSMGTFLTDLRKEKGLTQQEVADSLKISRSYVSRIEKRALTKMYLYLKDE
jgi:RNA polymerase sporulation-specific sigma factor